MLKTQAAHCLCALLLTATAHAAAPRLAIVIDDIGYALAAGDRAIALPGPVTLAVLPFTPNAGTLAARARAAGKDVILHEPMEAGTPPPRPSPGTLTAAMDGAHLRASLRRALAEIPEAIGVSNHTGSLLTTRRQSMTWLMEEVHAQGLFFLDSRTTAATVAREAARSAGVPSIERDVFLDHVARADAVSAAFGRALALARRQGFAVVVGHPHAVTLAFLEHALPGLADTGVRLVPVRELLETPDSEI